jgi:hypothetical protein
MPVIRPFNKEKLKHNQTCGPNLLSTSGLCVGYGSLLSFFFLFSIFYISKFFMGFTYSSVLTCIFNTIIDFIWILIIFLILMYLI